MSRNRSVRVRPTQVPGYDEPLIGVVLMSLAQFYLKDLMEIGAELTAGIPLVPRVPAMGQSGDYFLTPTPYTSPPDPDEKRAGYLQWTAAGLPSYQLVIEGGRPLNGVVDISGSKNAALPILAACLLTDEPVILRNLPDIQDVRVMLQIMEGLGTSVEKLEPNVFRLHTKGECSSTPDPELFRAPKARPIDASVLDQIRRDELPMHRAIDLLVEQSNPAVEIAHKIIEFGNRFARHWRQVILQVGQKLWNQPPGTRN